MRYTYLCHLAIGLTTLVAPAASRAQITALGVMGDSLSDEYAEETYDYALSWVEQLAMFRDIDVGATAAQAGQPGSTWGEPRRTGYAYNWARSGATSASLLSQGQHSGLAAQMGAGAVSHAVLAIGQNDFLPYPFPGYAYYEIYNNRWTQEQVDQHVDQVVANIDAAVTTILAADGQLVLANIVDYGVAPAVWSSIFFSDPNKRDRVSAVIARLSDELVQIARAHELTLVDSFGFSKSLFGTNHDLREFLLVGNVQIALWESDTPSHDNPWAGSVDDGIHPATHVQAILGNLFLAGLNIGYNGSVPLFSEAEILSQAGLSYGGADTLAEQIGQYSDYVWSFALPDPYHDLNRNGSVDLRDFHRFQTCYAPAGEPMSPGCQVADFDNNDGIDLKDYAEFRTALTGP